MPFLLKQAYDRFSRDALRDRRPLVQKGFEPIRVRLEKALESDPSVIVEKVHYTSHPESIIEIVCAWVGLDAGEQAAVASLKAIWNPDILQAEEESVSIDPQEDLVYLYFTGLMPDNRFITGKVLIRC